MGVYMNIFFLASEVYPLIKTGGLADVAGALPAALTEFGENVRIMLPGYPEALDAIEGKQDGPLLGDPLGAGEARLVAGRMPDSGVPVWLVDCPALYARSGGPYQDSDGADWPDNHLRFALLAKSAAMVCGDVDIDAWRPDLLHVHDWQAGLAPAYLALAGGPRPASVMTIHNMHYPGSFPAEVLAEVGLPDGCFSINGVEFFGRISFLKAGLYYSDRITTVSPTYAREIQKKEWGGGFHGLLSARAGEMVGILNGVDYEVWNPATDKAITRTFTPARLVAGKAACKKALQKEFGLPEAKSTPLIGVVSRFAAQKGLRLLLSTLPEIVGMDVQLAIFGSGEPDLEIKFTGAARDYPVNVAARIGYDEGLAHRIQAGCDMLLVPSLFEPCGLTQLYAQRYGTLPLVHRTGGLADTVIDVSDETAGTGFVFDEPTAVRLLQVVERAVALYCRPREWRKVQRRAMKQDFSWKRSAEEYIKLYRELV